MTTEDNSMSTVPYAGLELDAQSPSQIHLLTLLHHTKYSICYMISISDQHLYCHGEMTRNLSY